jgi:uncharacterized membrane protein YphA (DoxX/SURF4 family)
MRHDGNLMLLRSGSSVVRLWISTVARLALASVLLVAGGLKITSPDQATRAVQAYELLPAGLDKIVGYGLPLFEVTLGLLLLLGVFTRVAAAITGVLMVVFIAAVGSAWARGLSIDCGCFGGGGEVAPDQTAYLPEILRDLLFLALAGWLVAFPKTKFAIDRHHHYDRWPEHEHDDEHDAEDLHEDTDDEIARETRP